MRHRFALRRQAWLLTVLLCFLAVAAVPSWRQVTSYYAQLALGRHGGLHLTQGGAPGADFAWLSFQDGWPLDDLRRVATRTGDADDWAVLGIAAAQFWGLNGRPVSPWTAFHHVLSQNPGDPEMNAWALWSLCGSMDPYDETFLDQKRPDAKWHFVLACANHGAAVQPNNGFWDYVRSVILFSGGRDAAALAAAHAAATKPYFKSYSATSPRLFCAALQTAGRPAFECAQWSRMYTSPTAILINFRLLARKLGDLARNARRQGNHALADQLRTDGMKLGGDLRDHGDDFLDALVGSAVQGIVMQPANRTNMQSHLSKELLVDRRLRSTMGAKLDHVYATRFFASGTARILGTGLYFFPSSLLFCCAALVLWWCGQRTDTIFPLWRRGDAVRLVLLVLVAQSLAMLFGWEWNHLAASSWGQSAQLGIPEVLLFFAVALVAAAASIGFLIWRARRRHDPFPAIRVGGLCLLSAGGVLWSVWGWQSLGAAVYWSDMLRPLVPILHFGLAPLAVVVYGLIRADVVWHRAKGESAELPRPRTMVRFSLAQACAAGAVLFALLGVALMPPLIHYQATATRLTLNEPQRERQLLDRWIAEARR